MEPLPPPLPTLGPIRIAAEASAEHPAYETLLAEAPRTGWCPVLVTDPERLMPPDDPAAEVARIALGGPVRIGDELEPRLGALLAAPPDAQWASVLALVEGAS